MWYEDVVSIFYTSLTVCSLDNTEAYDVELLLQQVVEVDFSRIANRLRLNSKYALSSSPLAKVQKVLEKDGANNGMLDHVKMLVEMNQKLKHLPLHQPGSASYAQASRMLKQIHDLVYQDGLTRAVSRIDSGLGPARAIDSLEKLGHYYRAVRQLVTAARRKKCQLFRKTTVMSYDIEVPATIRKSHKFGESVALLNSLEKEVDQARVLARFQGSASKADVAITKKLNAARSGLKVHAEIKLLLFYECHPQPRQPRVIAASKSSCYLCDQFCRTHGSFQTLATYGTFNEKWLLPDWVKPRSGARLRESVRQFDIKLSALLRGQLQGTQRRPLPIESLVGLSASWSSLRQPSISSRRQIETGPATRASLSEVTSVSSSSDPPIEYEGDTCGILTSPKCCRVESSSQQPT